MVLGHLALDAELGALVGDQAPRLRKELLVDRTRPFAALEQRDRGIRVSLHDERQVLLRIGFLARWGGGRRGLARRGHRGPDLLQRELPLPRLLGQKRRRILVARERNVLEGDALALGLLDVLGDDRAAQAAPWCAGRGGAPSAPSAGPAATPSARARPRNTSASETWVASGTASSASAKKPRRAPVAPNRAFAASPSARPTTPPVSISAPKRKRRPNIRSSSAGTERKRRPKPAAFEPGFSSSRCQKRLQPQKTRAAGTPQAASPEQGVQGGTEGGPEAADPVARRRAFAGRQREEVGVVAVVRDQGEGRQDPCQKQKDPERLARPPAAKERTCLQSVLHYRTESAET